MPKGPRGEKRPADVIVGMTMHWQAASCCAVLALICTRLLCTPASAEDSTSATAFNYKVISDINLTKPFHTKSKWRFVVTQEPDEHYGSADDPPEEDYPGSLHFCFVRDDKPDCSEPVGRPVNGMIQNFNMGGADVIYPRPESPLLRVVGMSFLGGSSSGNPTTILWAYRHNSDKFERIFLNYSLANNNEETRLVTTGPLTGDIIVSNAPRAAPYRYGIIVYRLSRSGHYVQILKFAGKTRYADGNRLAVIDSEMPRIETRLHLRNPGDALPVPLRMPEGCNGVELHKDGTEWCAGARESTQ